MMRAFSKFTRTAAATLALSLCIESAVSTGSTGSTGVVQAAAKPALNATKKTLKVGASFVIKIKGVKKASWSSANNKVVKITQVRKNSVKAVAVKKGKTNVYAKYKAAGKNRKLKCTITVKKGDSVIARTTPDALAAKESATAVVTATPAVALQTPAGSTQTPVPTEVSTPTPVPTTVPTPSVMSESGAWAYIPVDDDSLLKEYEGLFGNVGTCLTYDVLGKRELQDPATMEHVRKNYNSYTLENEMKPSYILADPTKDFRNPKFNDLISREEAQALGYIIPTDYTENVVPKLNFERLDTILRVTKENGIRMRGHTLIWHSQTPFNFFRRDYSENGPFVSAEEMDQRIIFYITNVMKHVIENPDGDVVYTWDVVNEFYHQLSDGTDRNWSDIYNIEDSKGLITKPTYVKLSFKTAYDVLKEYGLQDKVPLFYNDYNTSQVSDKIVDMVNYINSADELNPDGEKICAGVGMQCHLGIKWPSVTEQLDTVKKFIDAGFEVQITELDIVNDTEASEEEYCMYWFRFMEGLVQMRKAGAPITGVTFWGLSDAVTWRWGKSALLYGKDINDPKKALYAVYAAAQTGYMK